MKASLLWLPLLLQGAIVTCADTKADTGTNAKPGKNDGRPEALAHSDVGGRTGTEDIRDVGAELFDAATLELRKIPRQTYTPGRKGNRLLNLAMKYALKALPSFRISIAPQATSHKSVDGPLLDAVKLLETAAQHNNSDALFTLAEINFYGNYSHPKNFGPAFDYYLKLAELTGNSSAMFMVGFMYSTGIGQAVERDQAKALLYYTFAAAKGHTRAEMVVAARHHAGIGTPKSCEVACNYYKRVADKGMEWYRAGPPGARSWVPQTHRIADDIGGVYGEGASVSSSGMYATKAGPSSDVHASIEDIIEYLDLMSQKGDFKASFNLGRIYYEGQRGLAPDLLLAKKYFLMVVMKYWKNGRPVDSYKAGLEKTAAKAAGYIGRMYMRGEGVNQNFDKAKQWFDRGISEGDPQSQYSLGLLLLNGYGLTKNIAKGSDLLRAAAEQDYAPAQVEMGALFLDQGQPEDVRTAHDYFDLASRYGQIESQYYLAELIHHKIIVDKPCSQALLYYKAVSEKVDPLVSSWQEANQAFEAGDYELALLDYLLAAEQGYEKAQNNVAYLLDPQQSSLRLPSWLVQPAPKAGALQDPTLGLMEWTRSSRQGNVDSLVKMGDYYLNGIGVEKDIDKAVQCYTGAAEYQQSGQALYNLGWMHENGIGLNQDYHLAKRYYDSALAANEEAYLPVTLSLLKLRMKSAWNTFTNGRINSIQDEPAKKKDWSLSEWIANFIQEDDFYGDDAGAFDDIYDDPVMPGGEDDPAYGDELDDGLGEGLIIVGLISALVFLFLYRQRRQQAAQREEEERRRRQGGGAGAQLGQPVAVGNNGGFWPPPGDPAAQQWAVGGVGH